MSIRDGFRLGIGFMCAQVVFGIGMTILNLLIMYIMMAVR